MIGIATSLLAALVVLVLMPAGKVGERIGGHADEPVAPGEGRTAAPATD
jgi:hypothetical protein